MPVKTKPLNRLDPAEIRRDFPILSRKVSGKSLVYLDSGATAQKPRKVMDAITAFYENGNANIHRGVHTLSQEATTAWEKARSAVQKHLNAKHTHEIIFTSGTTGSINLVASCFGRKFIDSRDEILVTEMEHHSNILPWQQVCDETGAVLKVIPVNERGELVLEEYKKMIGPRTSIVAVAHVSNTLGTVNPVKEIVRIAHESNIPVLIDGAQAVPHMKVDVQDIDADFYCFSGHKVYGPTGIGVLFGKEQWLKRMPNYQVGGGTIKTVTFSRTDYADLPLRFEAGTPDIAGAIGLEAAFGYVNAIGMDAIEEYEHSILVYATERLQAIPGLRIIGTANQKTGVISFVMEGMHPYDIGMILDKQGIAVRTGHHCTQPLMERFGIMGTVRVSLAVYNTQEEIDILIDGICKARKMLGH